MEKGSGAEVGGGKAATVSEASAYEFTFCPSRVTSLMPASDNALT